MISRNWIYAMTIKVPYNFYSGVSAHSVTVRSALNVDPTMNSLKISMRLSPLEA